jgi:hypothetical protein
MNQPGPAEEDETPPAGTEGSQASTLAVSDGEPGAGELPARSAQTGTATVGTAQTSTTTAGTAQTSTAQTSTERGGWRFAPHSRVARQIWTLIGFVASGILFTWPRATYLWRHDLPNLRDAGGFVWGFWWVARSVVHLNNPWDTHYMAAPVGTQLGFHTLMPLPGLVMTPITLAFGPSASYNLACVITPGLVAYAMYRAARLWVPSQIAAVAAGLLYGLSSMLAFQSWYDVNLALGALFIPMALEAAVRLRRRPGWPPAVYLGVVLGAALLTDQESAVLAGLAGGLPLLPWLIAGPARAKRSLAEAGTVTNEGGETGTAVTGPTFLARLWPVLLAVVVASVVASPQIIAMAQQAAAGGASFPAKLLAISYTQYGTGLFGLISPSPHIATYGLQGAGSFFYQHGIVNPVQIDAPGANSQWASYVPMFGVSLTILAIAGLFVAARRRNAWWLAVLAVGCALLALGPTLWIGAKEYTPLAQDWNGVRLSMLMPYTWLVHVPGLENFREAYRFAELGLVAMALLAASAVQWLRNNAAKPVLAVVLILCLFELGWSGNPPGNTMPKSLQIGMMGTSYPKIDGPIAADHSSSIVVDFPFGIRGGPPDYGQAFNPQAQVLATADGHPLANALISRVPASTYSGIKHHMFYAGLIYAFHDPKRTDESKGFPFSSAARDAQRMNVGWVIVWPTHVPHAIAHYMKLTGFKLDYTVHGVQVYHR